MSDLSPRQQRLALIEDRYAEGIQLLATAEHETMKEQIHRSSRDLDEARTWLHNEQPQAEALKLVDLILELATWRLEIVSRTLKAHGPDARLSPSPD